MVPGLAMLNMIAAMVMSGCFFSSHVKLNPLTTFRRVFWHIRGFILFAQNYTCCNLNILSLCPHWTVTTSGQHLLSISWCGWGLYFINPKSEHTVFPHYTFMVLHNMVFQALWKHLASLYLLIYFKNCLYCWKHVRTKYTLHIHIKVCENCTR